ncbi:MAG: glycosyltransferase family 2 protein [Chloroflexi bacterium]|nr:glycosyltransferase family 2 protein [Chloroflexota bacterium]
MKDIGVCILTRSSRDVILDCLASLFEQTKELEMDVVVVDNDSRDDTVDLIRRNFPQVKLILNSENAGYSRGVNQGLRTLDARYYVLLNPDAVILDRALERLARFMDENPQAGICGSRVLNRDGSLQYQCRRGEARPGEVFSYFLGLDRMFPNDPRRKRSHSGVCWTKTLTAQPSRVNSHYLSMQFAGLMLTSAKTK